ncbi:Protein EFR3 [Pleurostoma richardsiae]|uniref:Protein EFR3 n=1 Tax=Pleurostoma richardsiae TaxID=41990 RepID=A0AA38VZ32_9PEZI|nr:Protein EFR3 [Pleurostoma richardsiae]
MNAIQQRCRPKHQVLVLKCYPRTTKGAVDVKPNSSELSYLLYYATSRKTKIQKVCSFLEKKTASDVWRLRIGNVQVTLQIIEALIEKNPKDLPLFAMSVIKIFNLILGSNDITMIESSLPTFEAFCTNHDASSLFADQVYLREYETVVGRYASLASTRGPPVKVQPSKPVALRWRNAGLEAIKSVTSSDALSSVAGRQYSIVVPMILENLWTDNDDFLEVLHQRVEIEEKVDSERLLKRRTSMATVRTAEEAGDTNPIALSGSALDVDKLAEEDTAVLAMQCLKQIFIVPNRTQIHAATTALLKFIENRIGQNHPVMRTDHNKGTDSGWAIKMFELVSRWAPVQDRYVILVTAMDFLVRTALTDEALQLHIVLTAMIGSLLRSDVNLIGLSVNDVLAGLIQHMKKLALMPGGLAGGSLSEPLSPTVAEAAAKSTSQRKELLGRIQHCIGDLATHVYYADQISDMITGILLRLKPIKSSSTANSSPRGEKTDAPQASVTSVSDDHHVDSLFPLVVAKTTALKAIKSILLVANPKTKISGNVSLSRNRVPIQVWEGTQWLLRDPDGQVRKAYADALITWLDRETTKADLRARDEHAAYQRPSFKSARELPPAIGGRRAVSSASNRDKPVRLPRSTFLQLLHVAIYDNALQFVDYETDIVLLHILLAKLVFALGVNAVRYGLPMIFRLQEDIQEVETPIAKVRIGSLCHGYFWTLTEVFDFEASVVGRAIHNEIIRRRSKHFWVEGVHIPPPLLELVGTPGMPRPQPKMPIHEIESEALLPFDDRIALVECICTGYQETTVSPPVSPAASPGRSFTHPILSSALSASPRTENDHELPSRYREELLTEWSREAAMIAIQSQSKSASLNGSRAGTSGTGRKLAIAVNGSLANGNKEPIPASPLGSVQNIRPASQPVGPTGVGMLGVNMASKLRKTSVRSGISPSPSNLSSQNGGYVTSVDQLKMVLSGHARPPNLGAPATARGEDDDSSDSMVSYDMSASELSFQNPQQGGPGVPQARVDSPRSRSVSRERKVSLAESLGPLNSNPPDMDPVPPVPPLPAPLAGETRAVISPPPIAVQDHALTQSPVKAPARRSIKSRGGDSVLSSAFATGEDAAPAMDLQSLLNGIDSRAGERGGLSNVTKPPY